MRQRTDLLEFDGRAKARQENVLVLKFTNQVKAQVL
jgi:hypothetical protein